jgi:aryl-alcohol dehydrogenase-like predicted oxidoreductase
LRVSALGLGTVKIGRNSGVKYPGGEGFALPSDEQVTALLRAAREEGVNVIDTAPAYGASEERLGEIMRANGWFGEGGGNGRVGWVVVTKTGEEFDGRQSSFDFTPEHTRRSVERSLRRLGCEVLDCVLVHSDGRDEEIIDRLGTLEALEELAGRGLVRSYGISTKTAAGALRAVERLASQRTGGRGVLMATLNPGSTEDLPAIRAAGERGVGVLIKKALGSGHLARPATEGSMPDPVEASLRFVFEAGGSAVSSVVVGTASAEHLRANAAAARRVRSA